jgi:glutathione synthase/RimK-type ligase-like ATP-grasp enzyme
VYSQKWLPEELQEMAGLEFSPMIFQEYVEKDCEFRVIIVGEQIFCGKIPSQQSEDGQADWRKDANLIDEIEVYELPASVKLKLLHLMDYFRLNYGAIDLIKTPEGKYVFLEINPVGEFSWLDKALGHKISEAIANVLLNRARRRNSPLNLY